MSNFSDSLLSREQMKSVKGGDGYSCQCNGVGTWTGNYSSQHEQDVAVAYYCRGGGKCHLL